ncbi:MAG: tetratricopeptide repeat protein [Bacteroidota bacterium]
MDKLIWYGRRAAYLGFFQKAIDIYSQGLEKYPEETRLYRHRGHRYISTRQYKKAKADFEKAVDLIEGQKDQMEPDGLPNAKNIPLTTLHSNILYHLGLVYYLEGEYSKALDAFKKHNEHPSYDDTIVSGTHWMYMILRRMGEKEKAQAILASIHPDMEIIENDSYFECCLFYKGLKKEDELLPKGESQSSDDVFVYALGNWQMYEHSDRMKTRIYFEQLLKEGNPYSFAYLAAEADWKRLAPQH